MNKGKSEVATTLHNPLAAKRAAKAEVASATVVVDGVNCPDCEKPMSPVLVRGKAGVLCLPCRICLPEVVDNEATV